MKRKIMACFLTAAAMMTILAGCGDSNKISDDFGNNEVKDTLILAVSQESKMLDPQATTDTADYSIINNIYDTLVDLNLEDGSVSSRLAETWEVSEDNRSYTFHLRENVKWQNGEIFTADDVKFTYERAKESAYCVSEASNIASVEVVDANTVVVNFENADPYALQKLGIMNMAIVNQKAVEAAGEDFGRNPVGTGSYTLESWSSGNQMVLERFDDCWRGKAALKTVTVRVISDYSAKVMSIQSADVDMIDAISSSEVDKIKNTDGVEFMLQNTYEICYIGMNETQAPFDNKLVRQAISYAINKEDILIGGSNGLGEVSNSILADTLPGYKDMSYPYDPDKARELLAEAGYPDGLTVDACFMATADSTMIVPIIQQQLAEVGVTLNIQMLEVNAWIQNVPENTIFWITCKGNLPNADSALYAQLHSSARGLSGNLTYVNDAEIDRLLDAGRVEFDEKERVQIYEQVQDLMKDDASMIPVHTSPKTGAVVTGLQGCRLWPVTMYYFYDYYWA